MYKQYRSFARVAALAVPLVLGACDKSATSVDSNGHVSGTYKLSTIAGHSIPYTIDAGGGASETISAATLKLNSDGSCTSAVSFTDTFNGQSQSSNESANCTYIIDSGFITLDFADGDPESGTFAGNSITMDEGDPWVFKKQ